MASYQDDIKKLKDPNNINEALFASSPYVLRKAFERDPIVQRMIRGRQKVVPLIIAELTKDGLALDDITLACFTYILEKVDPKALVAVLPSLFENAVDSPEPFFVHFAAHTLRHHLLDLPVEATGITYTQAELVQTLKLLKQQ
jgi:hypothetical protein